MEHAVAATPAWAVLAYLAAGVLFILSLRGLSSPETSQAGNRNGMIGMGIAVGTTLILHPTGLPLIVGAIAIGGGIGWVIAQRIQMTAMPELVAGFHSLVGMAAVLVGCSAYLNPAAFGIVDGAGAILTVSRVELRIFVKDFAKPIRAINFMCFNSMWGTWTPNLEVAREWFARIQMIVDANSESQAA